jgi:adenylate cyclase
MAYSWAYESACVVSIDVRREMISGRCHKREHFGATWPLRWMLGEVTQAVVEEAVEVKAVPVVKKCHL